MLLYPVGAMYAIFTYIYDTKSTIHVGKYTIFHGYLYYAYESKGTGTSPHTPAHEKWMSPSHGSLRPFPKDPNNCLPSAEKLAAPMRLASAVSFWQLILSYNVISTHEHLILVRIYNFNLNSLNMDSTVHATCAIIVFHDAKC